MTAPNQPDPWKSFRGVMAGTLILEVIVVLLALPVVSVFHGGLTPVSSGYLIGMAIVLALMSGMQGRSWALWANIGMQFVLILGAFIDVTIGIVGIIFLLVWVLIAYLRSEVKRRQDRGLLPGQQS
ncbi:MULTISPECIES: DUF4233 domain-containing protein [Mycolicibacterium]|uniref:DUF4233 domain-containing protein n=2 Tax=Mycolicibacterium TaxID=1866885 RepID=A0A7I7ZLC5_9MYCO|nr:MULTISPECIES: DUF4233 domain-containing protein [Mycolicibacterium]MCX8557354.1 DUF4233 domain-containing protein [Mycolicibacterium mucogenicum]TLH71397.1 DUF4233 domain-containing protein [Mycolicibacterium phocaicum]BBZ55058.1 membrane protein [Mycolicibacterium phocaicum]SHW64244.1 integral membrane protein [Mycobacteroides abscessus subsp. abscessus]